MGKHNQNVWRASIRRMTAVGLAFLLCAAMCSGCHFRSTHPEDTKDSSDTLKPVESEPENTTGEDSDVAGTEDTLYTPTTDDTDVPFQTTPPDTDLTIDSETTVPPETDVPTPDVVYVPESEPVEDDYFLDAVFIGDSRTVGLSLYSGLRSNYYAEQGLNVSSVMKKEFIPSDGVKLTLADALAAESFRAVYISFGINEIGWGSTQGFIDTYQALIELVESKLPGANIYVQSILPMTREASESELYSAMGGNAKVAEYNRRLAELCESMGHYFINLDEIFTDENGDLKISDTTDGIHLGVQSCTAWVDYLRNHVVS